MNQVILEAINDQDNQQVEFALKKRKSNGIYFTNELNIIDSILDVINFDKELYKRKILDPAVGNGIFLMRILEIYYNIYPNMENINYFIENGLIFIDNDPIMIAKTKENISSLFESLFNEPFSGSFNSFVYDFTIKTRTDLFQFFDTGGHVLSHLLGNVDYVIGNPPYVTLYGRRDNKRDEIQRIQYLEQYKQFPNYLKNGKINYVMLFLEHSLDFLRHNGTLAFIIDVSFFESAYKYTRKYLLENTQLLSLETNISNFDNVASGQIIIKLRKAPNIDCNHVKIKEYNEEHIREIDQTKWYNELDEYKFRIRDLYKANPILDKIRLKATKTLHEQYPGKALRTCAMLLNMEDEFTETFIDDARNCQVYKYYQGSKALYSRFCTFFSNKYFYYDKTLQDNINNQLKDELLKKGIKNKKRIGLGDSIVFDNPKVYIRQSAKEIIASFDDNASSANNSLYVFSLKNNNVETKAYLKFLCGYLNSEILSFFAQEMEVIRYRKGKQPQIKISDLYSIPVPEDPMLKKTISCYVEEIYNNEKKICESMNQINIALYDYFELNRQEIVIVKNSIADFLKS